MKTKELEKYPLQILMMTLTSFLTLLIPKLLSYLIDDILMANNKEKEIRCCDHQDCKEYNEQTLVRI